MKASDVVDSECLDSQYAIPAISKRTVICALPSQLFRLDAERFWESWTQTWGMDRDAARRDPQTGRIRVASAADRESRHSAFNINATGSMDCTNFSTHSKEVLQPNITATVQGTAAAELC